MRSANIGQSIQVHTDKLDPLVCNGRPRSEVLVHGQPTQQEELRNKHRHLRSKHEAGQENFELKNRPKHPESLVQDIFTDH